MKIGYKYIGDGVVDEGDNPLNPVNEVLLNSNDITNLLVHEYDHLLNLLERLAADPNFNYNRTYQDNGSALFHAYEKRATLKQIKHSSWSGTSIAFKQHIWDAYGTDYVKDKSEIKKYFGKYGVKTESDEE